MNDMISPGAAPETQVARIALVKPSQAAPEVAAVYADIKASKGTKFLTPTWGFFAHDPELLRLWWGLQKRLQKNAGEVPKKVMLGIMFVCASEIGCPRCINNAQVQLQDQFGLSDAEIQDLADFEACDRISAAEKAVYRFCLKAAFDRPTSAEDFAALRAAGDLTGKVVIDITNPLTADFMGLSIGHSTSAAEEIQKAFPEAKVIKAFNTVFAQVLSDGPMLAGETVQVYFAGDDAGAKETVKALIQSMGFAAVDAGSLKNARYLEPLAGLNIYFGYGAGKGTSIAPTWIGIQ